MLKQALEQLLSSPDAVLPDDLRGKLHTFAASPPRPSAVDAARLRELRPRLVEACHSLEAGKQALQAHFDESREQRLVLTIADIRANTAALREGIALEQRDWLGHRLAIQRTECQRAWWPDDASEKLTDADVMLVRSPGSRRSRISLTSASARTLAMDHAFQLYALLVHNVGTTNEQGPLAARSGVQRALLRHFNLQDPRNAFREHAQACVDLRNTFGCDASWPAWPEVSNGVTNLPTAEALAKAVQVAPPGTPQRYPFPQSTSVYFQGSVIEQQYQALYADFVAPTWGKALIDTLRQNLMLVMLVVSTSTQTAMGPTSKAAVAFGVGCIAALGLVSLATVGWKKDVRDATHNALKQLDARLRATVFKQQAEFGSLLARVVSAFHANARAALDKQVAEETRRYERTAKEHLRALQLEVKVRSDAATNLEATIRKIIAAVDKALAGAA